MIPYASRSASNAIIDHARTAASEPRPADRFVSALVGLDFEARIAAGPGVFVICRDTETKIEASLSFAIKSGCRSFISFGVAGGPRPAFAPGRLDRRIVDR